MTYIQDPRKYLMCLTTYKAINISKKCPSSPLHATFFNFRQLTCALSDKNPNDKRKIKSVYNSDIFQIKVVYIVGTLNVPFRK